MQVFVGIKPTYVEQSEHVVGVHVDPSKGWFVTVLGFDGVQRAQFELDEYTIATWLRNELPEHQAQILRHKRTAKERHHRVADALVAICQHYTAQIGVENIRYRSSTPNPTQQQALDQSSRTIVALLQYKLARVNLPASLDIGNIAPTKDCSRCGTRHATG